MIPKLLTVTCIAVTLATATAAAPAHTHTLSGEHHNAEPRRIAETSADSKGNEELLRRTREPWSFFGDALEHARPEPGVGLEDLTASLDRLDSSELAAAGHGTVPSRKMATKTNRGPRRKYKKRPKPVAPSTSTEDPAASNAPLSLLEAWTEAGQKLERARRRRTFNQLASEQEYHNQQVHEAELAYHSLVLALRPNTPGVSRESMANAAAAALRRLELARDSTKVTDAQIARLEKEMKHLRYVRKEITKQTPTKMGRKPKASSAAVTEAKVPARAEVTSVPEQVHAQVHAPPAASVPKQAHAPPITITADPELEALLDNTPPPGPLFP